MDDISKERLCEIINNAISLLYGRVKYGSDGENSNIGDEMEYVREEIDITEEEYYFIIENGI